MPITGEAGAIFVVVVVVGAGDTPEPSPGGRVAPEIATSDSRFISISSLPFERIVVQWVHLSRSRIGRDCALLIASADSHHKLATSQRGVVDRKGSFAMAVALKFGRRRQDDIFMSTAAI